MPPLGLVEVGAVAWVTRSSATAVIAGQCSSDGAAAYKSGLLPLLFPHRNQLRQKPR
jgi:hypothetical protein